MNLILLYILFVLSILPTTVFFVSTSGNMLFYVLQFIFLFFQLFLNYRINNKIKLSIHWVIFILAIVLSISGYVLHVGNFIFSSIFSLTSLIILALNASLFFSISKKLNYETVINFQKHFHFLSIVFLVIGVCQYFGYLNFSMARSEYFTQNGSELIQNSRSTSIFIEPSAWAIYYSIYLLFCFPRYKVISVVVALISMILSYSASGFVIIFCILFYIFFYRKYFWLLISIGISLGFSLLYYLESLNNDLLNKILFNSSDYRNVAPKAVFIKMIENRPETILFGNGIFSLMNFTDTLGLSEKGQTTSNFFVDIFFELGVFSIIIIVVIFIKSINNNYKLLLLLAVFVSQCGYRSYQLLLIIFLFNKISEFMYKSKSKSI